MGNPAIIAAIVRMHGTPTSDGHELFVPALEVAKVAPGTVVQSFNVMQVGRGAGVVLRAHPRPTVIDIRPLPEEAAIVPAPQPQPQQR